MRIPTGVTDQYIYFVAVDATDLKTRETGLSGFTVYRSRNGAASAAYTTPTVNETDSTNMPGVYELLLDEDMAIDSGDQSQEICLHITHASMAPVTRVVELYRPSVTAGETLTVASGVGSANAVAISGDTAAADNLEAAADGTGYNLGGGGVVVASVAGAVGSVTGNVGGNVTGSVGSVATGGITAASIADAAIDAATFAADVDAEARGWLGMASANLDTQLGDLPTNAELATSQSAADDATLAAIAALNNPSAAAIADAVWDEAQADHVAVGSFGITASEIADILTDTGTTLQGELDGIQADTEDIQSRLPAALIGGRIDATVDATGMESGAIDAILDDTIGDGSITMRQALRVLVAGMVGKISGAATTTVTIRNLADSADVVVATVDADGNRSAVTVTP